jgi:hypothetical protein
LELVCRAIEDCFIRKLNELLLMSGRTCRQLVPVGDQAGSKETSAICAGRTHRLPGGSRRAWSGRESIGLEHWHYHFIPAT